MGKADKGGILPEAEIRRKTSLDALQHPATLLSLALCLIAATYWLLLSPMFGSAAGAGAIAAISAAAAGASYLYHYSKEYPKNLKEITSRLQEERLELEEAGLDQLCADLRSGFRRVDSAEGTKALGELLASYGQLQASLAESRMTDPLSLSPIASLAAETYRRGLSVLADALELMKATRAPGKDNLEEEIAWRESNLAEGKNEGIGAERMQLKEETLAASRKRLEMLHRLQLCTDQLLNQVYRCQGSLQAARLELATVRVSGLRNGVDSVVEALERTLDQVKEVQDELERLGH